MKDTIRSMNSKMHRVISSVPEIERVLEEMHKTPFTAWITNTPVRHNAKIKIAVYDGKTDPSQHIMAFNIVMRQTQFTLKEKEAGYCQFFVAHLVGAALTWFSR